MKITEAMLKCLVARLNTVTKSPAEPYVDGVAQVGNFHISHAYGGVCLHRMYNTGGGVSDVFSSGHGTKRELYLQMHALLRGYELANEGV